MLWPGQPAPPAAAPGGGGYPPVSERGEEITNSILDFNMRETQCDFI